MNQNKIFLATFHTLIDRGSQRKRQEILILLHIKTLIYIDQLSVIYLKQMMITCSLQTSYLLQMRKLQKMILTSQLSKASLIERVVQVKL